MRHRRDAAGQNRNKSWYSTLWDMTIARPLSRIYGRKPLSDEHFPSETCRSNLHQTLTHALHRIIDRTAGATSQRLRFVLHDLQVVLFSTFRSIFPSQPSQLPRLSY
jgi:hypothetical protein